MKGYHPLAGGLLDDSSPLMWTKVHVQVRKMVTLNKFRRVL